jgi:hypothetical protein
LNSTTWQHRPAFSPIYGQAGASYHNGGGPVFAGTTGSNSAQSARFAALAGSVCAIRPG